MNKGQKDNKIAGGSVSVVEEAEQREAEDTKNEYLEERVKQLEQYTFSAFVDLDDRRNRQMSVLLKEIENVRGEISKLRSEVYELYITQGKNEKR